MESEAQARSLARSLIDDGIAACVQWEGPVHSVYQWEGKTCESTEWRLWIKVLESRLPAARKRIDSTHPYETPQWIEVEAAKVDEKYLKWAGEASNLRGFQKPEPI